MIEKNLRNIGNSWGIIIPKPILEGLDINPVKDKVELYIENNEIRIRKIKK
ncbi:AbrB/MazE/SpoVT family DNA-binding domain-containing protein [bacterium]|nr:AbrB/MazE/SpoVT family DNA-binding domain-containing protein [bacterium]